ncbi:hypothetical protein EDD37DRAFT_390888 [Exophiala viscosa]|uniref:VOC domain-containing protein n=1 Tax=Exophiala viscosa TaxID=2486360 RepID=A0AAN6DYV1_9EURO|nr:hypothetical protein EDD36DRAFT_177960 [Exophiala viscosa]KAI1623942.1 hypothetical protein EDD37DRAFT_390888 [Exophiala viscosa]
MPADHFSLTVPESAFEGLITFLTTSLAHFGFKEMTHPTPGVVGLGEVIPYFWIKSYLPEGLSEKAFLNLLKTNHVAFTAENSEQVNQFHAAALKAGGTCNGPPGLRQEYHAGYYGAYGAFVRDPACGVNFEVVCHLGE